MSGVDSGSTDREVTTLSTILLHLLENSQCVYSTHKPTEHVHQPPSSSAGMYGPDNVTSAQEFSMLANTTFHSLHESTLSPLVHHQTSNNTETSRPAAIEGMYGCLVPIYIPETHKYKIQFWALVHVKVILFELAFDVCPSFKRKLTKSGVYWTKTDCRCTASIVYARVTE